MICKLFTEQFLATVRKQFVQVFCSTAEIMK